MRHGESTANAAMAAARVSGEEIRMHGRDADVPLSAVGRDQAARLGVRLASRDHDFAAVLCSPYRRTRETLDLIEQALRAAGRPTPPVRLDERLCDRRSGGLEMLTPAAVSTAYPQEVARMAKLGPFAYRPPGGESLRDVAARLYDAFADICRDLADTRVLLVAHDAVVLMLRGAIEGLGERELGRIAEAGPVRNASITRWVRHNGRLRLAEYDVTTR